MLAWIFFFLMSSQGYNSKTLLVIVLRLVGNGFDIQFEAFVFQLKWTIHIFVFTIYG